MTIPLSLQQQWLYMLSHYLRVDFQPNVTISYIYLLLTATCNPEKGLQSAHACAGAAAAWEGPNLTSNVHGGLEKKGVAIWSWKKLMLKHWNCYGDCSRKPPLNSSYLFLHVKCFLLTSYWNHVFPNPFNSNLFTSSLQHYLSAEFQSYYVTNY